MTSPTSSWSYPLNASWPRNRPCSTRPGRPCRAFPSPASMSSSSTRSARTSAATAPIPTSPVAILPPTPAGDRKQVVLDLTDASDGNANGVGTADFTTVRLARKMDLGRTYPNALTSTVPGPVALPMVLPSDRLAIAASLLTCNAVGHEPRLVRIKNTLRLDKFWVSAALLDEVARDPNQRVVAGPGPVRFDGDGNLVDLTAEYVGAPIAPSAHRDAW
jgi:hypothetical protein